MIIELGNPAAKGANGELADLGGAPTVTTVNVPDTYSFDPNLDVAAFKQHLYDAVLSNSGVTNFGNDEQLLCVVHPSGLWAQHCDQKPTWVFSVDNPALAKQIATFYGIPDTKPGDVEMTHYTRSGPPGTGPSLVSDAVANVQSIQALLVNSGRDIWALQQAGGLQAGLTGTATSTTATTLVNTAAPFSATSGVYNGQAILTPTAYGVIQGNTTTTITVDRWYSYTSPGGAAASTPSGTTTYMLGSFTPDATFVALSTTNAASVSTDTSMSGEITTTGGGLVRKIAPYAHSAGTNTYTLTPVFTANGSDSLPATVYRIGVFTSMVYTATATTMMFETLLSASATLSASGDTLTVTETVTGS